VTIEEEWLYRGRGEFQKRYGVETYVAVYDWAIIDWGHNSDEVRLRAEMLVGDTVFVGAVPSEPPDDYRAIATDMNARMEAYRAYRDRFEAAGDKRRFRLPYTKALDELNIIGEKTTFVACPPNARTLHPTVALSQEP
jgi:hypothetical protein